ncbi:MAG TPA: hypothetical protein DEH05_17800, partial [Propionibacteriaceae bacterium]|nr:hypothetical protein [Propionibacteriaceae bacterium]
RHPLSGLQRCALHARTVVLRAPWALQKAYLTLATTDSSTMGVVQSRYSGRAGCHSEIGHLHRERPRISHTPAVL